jgi:hypothetical protein
MMPVCVCVADIAPAEHVESEQRHSEAGADAEPWVEMVRNYVFRGVQGDEAERVDARGVCDGHKQAEEQGMGGRSLRPYKVGGHNRFSMSGLERVQTPERNGDQRRRQHKP